MKKTLIILLFALYTLQANNQTNKPKICHENGIVTDFGERFVYFWCNGVEKRLRLSKPLKTDFRFKDVQVYSINNLI